METLLTILGILFGVIIAAAILVFVVYLYVKYIFYNFVITLDFTDLNQKEIA